MIKSKPMITPEGWEIVLFEDGMEISMPVAEAQTLMQNILEDLKYIMEVENESDTREDNDGS